MFLRSCGVDARLDLPAAEYRQDWSLWMAEQIREADHILVIASGAYREHSEGRTGPAAGRGTQWEARLIRDAFYRDQHALNRFLPVVLPGQTVQGIPDFLAGAITTVYEVDEFTVAGAERLLRFLTGQPAYSDPPIGAPPSLPSINPVEAGPVEIGQGHRRARKNRSTQDLPNASMDASLSEHRTVLVVDVEGLGDRRRTNHHDLAVRDTTYRILRRAFRDTGIPWDRCHREDQSHGVFVLAPPETPKSLFIDSLPATVVDALISHNQRAAAEEQIRLRMGLHAGEIQYNDFGVTATSITLAFNLADSQPLKMALAESPGVLAVMVSTWFFDEVVRHRPGSNPSTFRPCSFQSKETVATGWVSLPDHPYPHDPGYLQQHLTHSDGHYLSPGGVSDRLLRSTAPGAPYAPGRTGQLTNREGLQLDPQDSPLLAMRTLPRDNPAFTGRTAELDGLLRAVTEAVESGGILAIHAIDGMAGIGKTAFAVHVGHRLVEQFPDAQLFVRLHGHTPDHRPVDPADALASLLATMGVTAQQIPAELDARAAMWRDRLAGKRTLLILDDAVSHSQVEPLLPAAADSLVMITSRRRLTALDAAVSLPLDILPLAEAAALFVRLSGRTVAPEDIEAVDQVVELCGRLPLAVSLLAGRLRGRPRWNIRELADELSSTHDRLDELRAEDIEVAAAFDLSFRELSVERQRFFRCLGLHPGPELDAYAGAALADISVGAAAAHLDSLYDDHLVDEPAFDRYRMHDLVREYVRNLSTDIPAAERKLAVGRLLDYYRDTASVAAYHIAQDVTTDGLCAAESSRESIFTQIDGRSRLAGRLDAWAWMRTETVNLVACAEYAIDSGWHPQVIDLAASLAKFLYIVGPWDKALHLHQAAVYSATQSGDEHARADALNRLGNVQRRMGDYRAAAATHIAALDSYTTLNDPAGQVAALGQLGAVRRLIDDYPGAAEAYTRALAMSRDRGDQTSEAFALNELGIVHLVNGDLQAAVDAHMQALRIYEGLDDLLGQSDAWNELGIARRTMGDLPAAIEANTRAVQGYHQIGDGFHEAFALNSLAVVWRMTSEYQKAIEAHQQALDISRALGDKLGEAYGLTELGAAKQQVGDLAAAEQAHHRALDINHQLGHRLGEAETLNQLGALLLAADRVEEAQARYRQALEIAVEVMSLLEEARALDGLGRCAASLTQLDTATRRLRSALTIFDRIGASEARGTREFIRTIGIPGGEDL